MNSGNQTNLPARGWVALAYGSGIPPIQTDFPPAWKVSGQSGPFIWYGAGILLWLYRGETLRQFPKQPRWHFIALIGRIFVILSNCVQRHLCPLMAFIQSDVRIERVLSASDNDVLGVTVVSAKEQSAFLPDTIASLRQQHCITPQIRQAHQTQRQDQPYMI